ncbi:MAG: hypothetical protein JWO03_3304 [Bacteroidetes bacterium]|nr:hypothetical protein [Bacteroidota bacterium]
MKKIFALLTLLFAIGHFAQAQTSQTSAPNNGKKILFTGTKPICPDKESLISEVKHPILVKTKPVADASAASNTTQKANTVKPLLVQTK